MVLHIAYRLPFKKWQARAEDKPKLAEEQKRIQAELRRRLGILVDVVVPGKQGTTNDGNTARTFFKESEVVAEVTGVDQGLIDALGTLLTALTCGLAIDPKPFKHLCEQTLQLYLSKYSWFYLPVTVHKILAHGADVIQAIALPIGSMSEEAAEARNKDFRNYREHFTRKFSRVQTVEDTLRRLLVTSDPVISYLRFRRHCSGDSLPPSVISLLKAPETPK